MGIKLYGIAMSTCAGRVMFCLNEKGLEFELITVDMNALEHKQPPFLAKNPFGQIPVLEDDDDDLTLFESRAINAYLCNKYKDSGNDLLRHSNLKESALIAVWLEVESQQFNPPISTLVYQLIFMPMFGQTTDEKVVEAQAEKLGKVLDIYEARLGTTKYLAGDFFSLADLNHISYTHYLMTTKMTTKWASLIDSRPKVKAWWEDISSRPAIKKVTEKMSFA